MRRIPAVLALAALAAGCSERAPVTAPEELVLPVLVTSNESHRYGAALAGHKERPVPVATRARGNAILRLGDDGASVHYKLIVANIRGVTQAHIHIAPVDSAGPAVVFLYGFNSVGVDVDGILSEGDFTAADLIPRPAIGFGGTMAELVQAIHDGRAYVNVHTLQWPAGEIRGQVEEHGPSR